MSPTITNATPSRRDWQLQVPRASAQPGQRPAQRLVQGGHAHGQLGLEARLRRCGCLREDRVERNRTPGRPFGGETVLSDLASDRLDGAIVQLLIRRGRPAADLTPNPLGGTDEARAPDRITGLGLDRSESLQAPRTDVSEVQR